MFFNRKRRRRFWTILSVAMIAGNLACSMTGSAAGTKIPEKENKPVSEEYNSKETLSTESSYVNEISLSAGVYKIGTESYII